MTEVLLDKTEIQMQSNRQIVSYFDHEFIDMTPEKIDADLAEMVEGCFTDVVLTMSERDIIYGSRTRTVETLVNEIRSRDMGVWLDPWGVGDVFGGEAKSLFKASGQIGCFCNPKLHNMINRWIDTAAKVGGDTVLWDEPEMKCDEHRNRGYEFDFLKQYTEAAGRLALSSMVVLPADMARKQQFIDVAALPDVIGIGADAYYPCVFDENITEDKRLDYVRYWSDYTKRVADNVGKESHGWVQTFWVPEDREVIISEHLAIVKKIVGNVAVWGYKGCESVPNFDGTRPGMTRPRVAWNATKDAFRIINGQYNEEIAVIVN